MGLPANAMQTCSSRAQILRTVLSSCNFATDFFSTPSTTMSLPLIPTCIEKKQPKSISKHQHKELTARDLLFKQATYLL